MKSICIKTNNSNCLNYLLTELNCIDIDKICFSCNEFKNYKNVIIHYLGDDNDLFFSSISSTLSNLVLDELEDDLLRKIIVQNYFYFDALERNSILDICFNLISDDFNEIYYKKYSVLYNSFLSFISCNKSLVLSGFVNFRLKDYITILSEIVDEAVTTFIVEKEYLEFISLLKLYINSQNPNSEIVHLIYYNEHSILLDKHKNVIPISDDLFNAKYLSDISFSSNDYSLNTLLTLLPKKIYVHLIDMCIDEFIHTIQLVFENRVELCTDCSICKLYSRHSNADIKNV